MKKFFIFLCTILLIFISFSSPIHQVNAEVELDLHTPSGVLMEPISKRIIYQKNPHEKLYPASMTKMMGLYLILEAIDENKITLQDEVRASKYACSMGGTQIFLEENEVEPLEDMLKAVAINSANDAIVALGEHLYGSNEAFIEEMNKKAKIFGMNDTHFANATGFDNDDHYTSSYDMCLLGCNLVSFDQKILKYTSLKEAYIREKSDKPFWLVNTNKLLRSYEGLDGLKTGFTQKAGYNLTATAKKKGVRLVSCVMKEDSIANRSQDSARLLDYGFAHLKLVPLYERGQIVDTLVIDESMNKKINLICKESINVILDNENSRDNLKMSINYLKKEPPFKKDELIAYLNVEMNNNTLGTFPLYGDCEIEKMNFWLYLLNFIKKLTL